MSTKVNLHIETDDMELAERIGQALNGTTATGRKREHTPEPHNISREETPTPKPAAPAPTATGTATSTQSASLATAPQANEPAPVDVTKDTPEDFGQNEVYPNGQEARDDLDKDGLPWDERIHASTKTQTADGRWKKKRGVADDVKAKVEAELKYAMALPSPQPQPESGGYTDPAAAFAGQSEPAQTPPPPAADTAGTPPPPAADTAAAPTTFMELVGEIGKRQATQADINAALQASNPPIPSFQTLGQRPDLIPGFWAALTGA